AQTNRYQPAAALELRQSRVNGAPLTLGRHKDVTGPGKRSVVRWIKELEEVDFLKVKRRGLGQSNVYELNLTARKRHA
ncbi:hypothetical protein, partial [Nioella nitratireducens]|uniref:hypothetical protein n=1 Tax=Nioella nitratireducens TaxID=1287720 RepID=UPI001F1FFDE7